MAGRRRLGAIGVLCGFVGVLTLSVSVGSAAADPSPPGLAVLATAPSSARLPALDPFGPPKASPTKPYPGAPGTPSPWTALTNQAPFSPGSMLLQTDGTVLVHDDNTGNWWRLSPAYSGGYLNGTWSQIASMPSGYAPLYFASAVLPSGQMIVEGGEYNGGDTEVETNRGAIYNPITNTWKSVSPPTGSGWSEIGDAPSSVLADGQFMLGTCCSSSEALLNPTTLTWTATGTNKADVNDEEGWTLLPSGQLLTVDVSDEPNTELYTATGGAWASAGDTPDTLVDAGEEIGPQVFDPNGTVFVVGATGATAVYHYTSATSGTWSAGPKLPVIGGAQYDSADGAASILPDGNTLFDASPGDYNSPTHFFVYNGIALTQIADTPDAPDVSSYYTRMLVLPTGQVLYDDGFEIDLYTPTGAAPASWQPSISTVPRTLSPGATYTVTGSQLAGRSQGAAYGDDFQDNTNYPIVRITNKATGQVNYARTTDPSSSSIASGAQSSAQFSLSTATPAGAGSLSVVADGIASGPVSVTTLLGISPSTLPGGTVGKAYSQKLTGSGGKAPYTWTRASGSLPPGLSLSSAGVISGTPTSAGTSSFVVDVADASTTALTGTQSYSIAVAGA
jgi:hypothetical protein